MNSSNEIFLHTNSNVRNFGQETKKDIGKNNDPPQKE